MASYTLTYRWSSIVDLMEVLSKVQLGVEKQAQSVEPVRLAHYIWRVELKFQTRSL